MLRNETPTCPTVIRVTSTGSFVCGEAQLERSTHERVRAGWLSIRSCDDYPHLVELVDAVNEFRQLETLFPFVSVGRLCFSRCTEFPYYVDFLIAFWRGQYSAEATLQRGGWVDTRRLGVGSAKEALAIVASHIPPDYGPARIGDASVLFPESD